MTDPVPPRLPRPVDLATEPDTCAAWAAMVCDEAVRTWGTDASRRDAESWRRTLLADTRRTARLTVVENDGCVVGGALLDQRHTTPSLARVNVVVAPHRRRRGIGSRLLDDVVAAARALGVQRLVTGVDRGPAGEPVGGEHFAATHGFTQFQHVLVSLRDLRGGRPTPPAAGYAVETCTDMPPEAWVNDLAGLHTRMSTDIPQGDADAVEDVWDVDRLVARHQRSIDNGMTVATAVARHLATGRLVGYTELVQDACQSEIAHQGDTLVVREHRGHGLGLALKSRLLADAPTLLPGARFTRTSNAVENVPMLAVNERLGYRREGEWTRWHRTL